MNKSIRKNWLMALMCLVAINAGAAPIDLAEALSRASQCVNTRAAGRMMPATIATLRLAHAEPSVAMYGATDYYVFTSVDHGGFVIVPGDDRAEQVLAYGDGAIDVNNLPCNLAWMLDQYKAQIEWLHAHPSAQVQTPRQLLPIDDPEFAIPPMLTCTWGQSEPYYNQCPMYNGERCVTGCVATAMAQVMYYWQFPNRVPALSGYRNSKSGEYLDALPSKPIDWNSMIDSYAQGYTPEQGEAVAMLMRYCGQSCNMGYSPNGSGAYVRDQLRGMMSFGYSRDASNLHRSSYSYEDWDALLKQDLVAGHPILYSGNDPNEGGHAFVLDGYYDGKYHINWGWTNTGNGYFALNAFVVRGLSFTTSHEILYNIHPNKEPTVTTNYDVEINGIYYKYNEDLSGVVVTSRDTKFDSYSGDVIVPSRVELDGKILPVTAIGPQAFRNCFGLTSVQLPDGLISIDRQAFVDCVTLQSISIPASVKTIGEMAFHDCVALTRVETPSLANWLDIDFVDQYANPLSCAHHLFVNGKEVKELVIDSAVKPYAFIECQGMKSLTINEGVTSLGKAAFYGCTSLEHIQLPGSLKEIARQTFYGCTGLKALTVNEGVESLGYAAFYSCTGLTAMTLPQSLVSIGEYAFNNCVRLTSIDLPDGVKTISDNAFAGCSGLKSVSLSDELTHIGNSAFSSCTALTSVTIPDKVTHIGEQAFERCNQLASVILGSGLKSIGNKAFASCQLIRTVKNRALTPPDLPTSNCFSTSAYKKATLYVPYDSRDSYRRSSFWKWFSTMIGADVEHDQGDVNGDGEITIADINTVIDAILNTPVRSFIYDVNYDGEVNIADINAVIDIILDN